MPAVLSIIFPEEEKLMNDKHEQHGAVDRQNIIETTDL